MRCILDTHALLWWFNEPDRLSARTLKLISNIDNTVFVSAAVAWEIAIKVNLGKLQALALASDLSPRLEKEGFLELPITVSQAARAGLLPLHHRDPFDRLLVAQAQELGLPILSADASLDRYDIKRIW
jgi:PIN domain nuclease of toxin-antitoxin system